MKDFKQIIPANGFVQMGIVGKNIYVEFASAKFKIKADNESDDQIETSLKDGDELRLETSFSDWYLFNESDADIVVSLKVGDGRVSSNTIHGIVSSKPLQADVQTLSQVITTGAGNVDLIVGADSTRQGLRIYNNGLDTIYLGDVNVNDLTGFPLDPFETWFENEAAAASWYLYANEVGAKINVQTLRVTE